MEEKVLESFCRKVCRKSEQHTVVNVKIAISRDEKLKSFLSKHYITTQFAHLVQDHISQTEEEYFSHVAAVKNQSHELCSEVKLIAALLQKLKKDTMSAQQVKAIYDSVEWSETTEVIRKMWSVEVFRVMDVAECIYNEVQTDLRASANHLPTLAELYCKLVQQMNSLLSGLISDVFDALVDMNSPVTCVRHYNATMHLKKVTFFI